jgi:hypothetical protein
MSSPIQQLEFLSREVAALRLAITKLLAQLEESAIRRDFTISEWCRKRRISRAEFYRLRARGLAPRVLEIAKLRRITLAADAEWEARFGSSAPVATEKGAPE